MRMPLFSLALVAVGAALVAVTASVVADAGQNDAPLSGGSLQKVCGAYQAASNPAEGGTPADGQAAAKEAGAGDLANDLGKLQAACLGSVPLKALNEGGEGATAATEGNKLSEGYKQMSDAAKDAGIKNLSGNPQEGNNYGYGNPDGKPLLDEAQKMGRAAARESGLALAKGQEELFSQPTKDYYNSIKGNEELQKAYDQGFKDNRMETAKLNADNHRIAAGMGDYNTGYENNVQRLGKYGLDGEAQTYRDNFNPSGATSAQEGSYKQMADAGREAGIKNLSGNPQAEQYGPPAPETPPAAPKGPNTSTPFPPERPYGLGEMTPDQRVNQAAQKLGVDSANLDPRIAEAARNGTLTNAGVENLRKVALGDSDGIQKALGTTGSVTGGVPTTPPPAAERLNQVAAALKVDPQNLDPRIATAVNNNTLTQDGLNRLKTVPLGDSAGIGTALQQPGSVNRAAGDPRLPAAETPNVDTRIPQTQPQRQGQQNPDFASALRGMQGGQGGSQGGGQGGFGSQNPYSNQFGQQGTCPVGTQLSYFNGQQACINTGLNNGNTQCPAGYTAAYAPNNTGLAGYGGNQTICVATGTTGGTCPTGQVLSVQSNGTSVCITQTTTDEAKLRDQAGYLDGVRVKDGACGLGIDDRFKSDANYLAGYNRGQAECRAGTGTTTSTTTVKYDVSDARARALCGDQIGNVSKELKDEKSLFILLFRERGTLSDTERKALGFDETIYKRLIEAKNQFDSGKADAVSVRDLDSERKENIGYREGYTCGRKMLESKQ